MENVKKINDELTVAGQVTLEQLQQAVNEGYKSVLNLRRRVRGASRREAACR